jgi:hypothetical protein
MPTGLGRPDVLQHHGVICDLIDVHKDREVRIPHTFSGQRVQKPTAGFFSLHHAVYFIKLPAGRRFGHWPFSQLPWP